MLDAIRRDRDPGVFAYPGPLVLGAAWLLAGTLGYTRHYFLDPGRTLDAGIVADYLHSLSCYLPWIALSALVFRLERRVPLGRPGWARHVAVLAGASIPITYVAAVATLLLATAVRTTFGVHGEGWAPLWAVPPRELLGHQFLYWPSVAAAWMLRALLEARRNERHAARLTLEKSQLETSLRQAELDVLRMRLDPHFLFNSLQNISVLTLHDPQTGSRMLTRLGELLRVALRRDARPETTLEAEVALTTAYLSVEQMRFGDRLSSLVDLAPGTESALVPTFLLQPLVENAIRHGLHNVRQGGVIVIRSRVEEGSLVLTVADNGSGPPDEPLSTRGVGIGLGATCERLARMYPDQHTFSMRGVPEGGTEVRIAVPLRFQTSTEANEHAPAAAADRG